VNVVKSFQSSLTWRQNKLERLSNFKQGLKILSSKAPTTLSSHDRFNNKYQT
jgi:hypothetical protein